MRDLRCRSEMAENRVGRRILHSVYSVRLTSRYAIAKPVRPKNLVFYRHLFRGISRPKIDINRF